MPHESDEKGTICCKNFDSSRAYNEATTMKTLDHRSSERFGMDESAAPPPPRRQSNARQLAPGYLWNSTTQELIPILPEDHPDYRQNQEIIIEAIRRWDQEASK